MDEYLLMNQVGTVGIMDAALCHFVCVLFWPPRIQTLFTAVQYTGLIMFCTPSMSYALQQVKESLCYVSSDFMNELQAARPTGKVARPSVAATTSGRSSSSNNNSSSSSGDAANGGNGGGGRAGGQGQGGDKRITARDYLGGALKKQFVLPDYHDVMKGYVKPDDEAADAKEQVRRE